MPERAISHKKEYIKPVVEKRRRPPFSSLTEEENIRFHVATAEMQNKKREKKRVREEKERIAQVQAAIKENRPDEEIADIFKPDEIAKAQELLHQVKEKPEHFPTFKRIGKALKNWAEKVNQASNDPFSYWTLINGYVFDGAIVDIIGDVHKRKKALVKIKEQGWESFDQVELQNISIDRIEKKSTTMAHKIFEKASTPRSEFHYDIHGRRVYDEAEVESVYGHVEVASPLFGRKPFMMEWRGDIKQTKQDAQRKEYEVSFVWNDELAHVVSAPGTDLETPLKVEQEAKKTGLDSIVHTNIPDYSTYYQRQETVVQGEYRRVPITRPMSIAKMYYFEITRRVFAELKKYLKENCFPDQAINPDYKSLAFQVSTEISQEIDQDREKEIEAGLSQKQFDEKIFYYGQGAEKFLEILNSEEYQLSNIELKLIKRHLAKLEPELQGKTIHDLGAANALKVVPLLEQQLQEQEKVEYVPIDINPAMIFAAAANINNPKVEVNGRILDFEKPLADKLEPGNKFFTLLGSTLGNGDVNYQQNLLRNIERAMTPDDSLLVGVHLKTDLQETLKMYDNPQGREFVMTTLESLGFSADKIKLEFVPDEDKRQIKILITVSEDSVVARGEAKFAFRVGEQLTIFVSQKYDVGELEALAQKAGLQMDKSFMDEKNQYELAVLKKK